MAHPRFYPSRRPDATADEFHDRARLDGQRSNRAVDLTIGARNVRTFLRDVEGDDYDGHVRSANGIRWRLA